MSGALHLLNSCSPRYTSKGPVVFAIFLLWPRDSVLHLSSPIPRPGTQVRGLTHTESPSGAICGLGRASLDLFRNWGSGEVVCCGLLAALQALAHVERGTGAAREDCSPAPDVAGEGSRSPQSRSGCPAAQVQPRCSALLVADVTVTQTLQRPLL